MTNSVLRELTNNIKTLSSKVEALQIHLNDVDKKISKVDFDAVKNRLDAMDVDKISMLTKKINGLLSMENLQKVLYLIDMKTDIIFVATLVSEWFTNADMLKAQAQMFMEQLRKLPPGQERKDLTKKFSEIQAEANKYLMLGQTGSTVLEKILLSVAAEEEKRYPILGKEIPLPINQPTPVPGIDIPKGVRASKMEDQKD